MSAVTAVAPTPAPARRRRWADPASAFAGMLSRDAYILVHEFPIFVAQVIVQPLFLLFVFGRVLTQLGYARPGYVSVLFPGLVGLATVLTSLQSTAMPLVVDFSYTREIEDRLLAPIPVGLVAVEKIVFAALRGMTAGAMMFPVGVLVLGSVPLRASVVAPVVGLVALGGLVGAALGLVLGTLVPPNRINIMFALILTPILFTGASQYPWPSLARLEWFQVVSATNPLTYVSEGLRGVMVPATPHISVGICAIALGGATVALTLIGTFGFLRRSTG